MVSVVRNLTLLRLTSTLLHFSRFPASAMSTAADTRITAHLQRLYALSKPPRLAMEVTGAGGQLFQWMLSVPGASPVVVYGGLPYATACTDELVGRRLEQYCSAEASSEMALAAYKQCANVVMRMNRWFPQLSGADVV